MDPETTAALEAIDAALAGQAVDPRYLELTKIAVLLREERPRMSSASSASLDAGVEGRLTGRDARARVPRLRRIWLWAPAAGLAASLAVAVVIVLSGAPVRTPSHYATATSSAAGRASSAPRASDALGGTRGGTSFPARAAASIKARAFSPGATATAAATAPAINGVRAPSSISLPLLQPPENGRKIIQGAQLALSTAPSRIETVAQEVFDVAGREGAIVQSSTVTAGAGGYAQFQLSVPSGSLAQSMVALSSLPYAHVASRTDTTQDVNAQYVSDQSRLADARALRTSLLRQLALATTQTQIESLTAQIHDAEASIASDQATLRSLAHQISYSPVTVMINGAPFTVLPATSRTSSGFTLGTAAHDAGRVLTVTAGVALIGLAALAPLALVGALAWWIITSTRRRRREQALDLA